MRDQPQVFSFETVRLDRRGAVVEHIQGQSAQSVEELAPGVSLELVAVPGGFFQMGSRDEMGYRDELPVHPVFLNAFWMGKHPVTQGQWQAVMGKLPACRFHGPDRPVENICWNEAAAFCERLSRQTKRRYSLPSEAQWEYACRAGTATPFSIGETITTDYANFVGEHTYRDAPAGVYRHETTPAGMFLPNPWGLYDMHGNVWEFCQDNWSEDYSGAPVDGAAQTTCGEQAGRRVCRGGSWHEPPGHCRSATRLRVADDDRMEYYGLRVVLLDVD